MSTGGSDPSLTKQFSFELTLEDYCKPASINKPPSITNLEYTITDVSKTTTFSSDFGGVFSGVPSECETLLSVTSFDGVNNDLDSKLTIADDKAGVQTLTLAQIDSLDLIGGALSLEKDWTITLTYNVLSVYDIITPVKTEPVTFTYKIKNPCVDENFVSITAPDATLVTKSYTIDSTPAETWNPFASGGSFQITTKPILQHSLCGDLQVEAQYEGVALT